MKRTIWSNLNLNLDDWKDFFDEEYPDMNEDERYDMMYEINNSYLDDERVNLTISTCEDIIAIADLGLWNGRHQGYGIIGRNLADILYTNCDFAEWYVDRHNNIRMKGIHHDGTNYVLYRMFKPGLSDNQKQHFIDKIVDDMLTSKDISRYTVALGDLTRY